MPPVYVTTQESKIRIENRRLAVEADGETLLALPLGQVSQLVLFGNITLTTPAIDALLAKGAEVIFLTARGDYRGRLVDPVTPHVPLRRAQCSRLGQPGFALEMAQGFVTAKLEHQRALLLRHNRDRRDPQIEEAAARVRAALDAVSRKPALSALGGLEGGGHGSLLPGLSPAAGAGMAI